MGMMSVQSSGKECIQLIWSGCTIYRHNGISKLL